MSDPNMDLRDLVIRMDVKLDNLGAMMAAQGTELAKLKHDNNNLKTELSALKVDRERRIEDYTNFKADTEAALADLQTSDTDHAKRLNTIEVTAGVLKMAVSAAFVFITAGGLKLLGVFG